MNWSEVRKHWGDFAPLLQTRWTELSEYDLERIAGDREALVGFLCRRYGFTPDSAEREVRDFEREARRPGAVR